MVIEQSDVGDQKKPVIPDHTCILVDCGSREEAHFLCAMLNSSPARLAVRNYIVLHPDPHVLSNLSVMRFAPTDKTHAKLAQCSIEAHRAARHHETATVDGTEQKIDALAAELWGLSDDELAEIRRSLQEA